MSSVFTPAVQLANRMSFSSKLLTVVVIFLIPYLWLLGQQWLDHTRVVNAASYTEEGIELILEIKPLSLGIARHRGISAQYLRGATNTTSELTTLEQELDAQFKQVIDRISRTTRFDSTLPTIAASWSSLKINGGEKDPARNFALHTALIEQIQTEITYLTDYFDIELQSTRDNYYLSQMTLFQIPRLQEMTGQLRARGASALTSGEISPENLATLVSLHQGIDNLMSGFNQQVHLLNRNEEMRQYFSSAVEKVVADTDNFNRYLNQQVLEPEIPTTTNSEFFSQATKVIESIGVMDRLASQQLINTAQQMREDANASRTLLLIVALACIILGCYLAMGILRALNLSVSSVNDLTQALKSGNFSRTLHVESKDVIGDVADNLTAMVSQVSLLINNIQDSADQVNKLSVDLQAVTDDTRVELDQQNNQTQQSASAATEMAATVREVARTCIEASSATDVARETALEGRTRVNDAITAINQLGNNVGDAKNIITELQDDVSGISAVLEVIRSIAEQTNLLALNAAIEAARAGEQGRGFAVVADEVRSLAKRTQDSTAEIRSVIEKLQQRAARAVDIILQSFDGAQMSVKSAASAGESLQLIVHNVEMLRDLNTQIATAAEQQATVAEQMSRSTRELGDSSENILDQVEKTLGYSLNMRQSASRLLENTLQFKI